jgi:hypothetical protein
MARQRVLIETKWSTPEATARAFKLGPKKRQEISKAVKKFLQTYKGGRLAPSRRHASHKAKTTLRRQTPVR